MENFGSKNNHEEPKKTNFNLIDVNVDADHAQDQLKINESEWQRINKFIESNKLIAKDARSYYKEELDAFRDEITSLNDELDDLMSVGWLDGGEVSVDNGKDTIYIKEFANQLNKVLNDFLLDIQKANAFLRDDFKTLSARENMVEQEYINKVHLQEFIAKLENKKDDSILETVGNIVAPNVVERRKKEEKIIKNFSS